jgi:hypothetical protein
MEDVQSVDLPAKYRDRSRGCEFVDESLSIEDFAVENRPNGRKYAKVRLVQPPHKILTKGVCPKLVPEA